MPAALQFAICNELFKASSLADGCAAIRAAGYTGIEIAPFTLAEDPAVIGSQERRHIRETLTQNELSFVGLHWLLASPPGLHATAADSAQREKTWDFLSSLTDLAHDLKTEPDSKPVLVFGSPKQRSTSAGMDRAGAVQILTAGLAKLAPHAEGAGVVILLEALSRDQCDVVNSLEEAVAIVDQVGSPAVQTMFDVHNAVDERTPHSELIRNFWPHIRHIHVNEMDGREPGTGNYDFKALLETLFELQYSGWVSLEAFDFERDPRLIASGSLEYLMHSVPLTSFAQTL